MIRDNIFKVKSTAGKDEYTVHVFAERCSSEHKCVPHCVAPECHDMCRCIMECSYIDYKSGHICKHIYKVIGAHRTSNSSYDTVALYSYNANSTVHCRWTVIMNHDSGFIIGIGAKIWKTL